MSSSSVIVWLTSYVPFEISTVLPPTASPSTSWMLVAAFAQVSYGATGTLFACTR